MTFNKMRFPIVWITLALCVVLCAIEVQSGPVDQESRLASSKDYQSSRSARQEEPYDEDSGEENDDGSNEENDDDGGEGDGGADDDDEEDEEERSLKRHVREASQKPLLVNEKADEDDSDDIPSTDATITDKPTKKPSVLLLLSTALDKAISATTKLPSQQMASDAASVFLLLGQVFSEAIDKVIGEDAPEEATAVTEIGVTEATVDELTPQLPIDHHPVKVENQPEINSSLVFPSSS